MKRRSLFVAKMKRKSIIAAAPIAFLLTTAPLVPSFQILSPPSESLAFAFSFGKSKCCRQSSSFSAPSTARSCSTSSSSSSSYTALFSTPTNAIDAEIIKSKRNALFPSNIKRPNSGSPLNSSTSSNGSSSSEEDTTATANIATSSTTTSSSESSISFLRAVDNFGMNLKPLAIQAYKKSNSINGGGSSSASLISLFHRIKSNILWMTYIIYRGYRGFFVILPAVFREVYRQLEVSDLVMDAYGNEDSGEADGSSVEEFKEKPVRLRTRITISLMSSILTLSYVVSGAFRVFGKFIKTFTNTTSFESSLEAAADEMVENEKKLRKSIK